MAFEKELQTLGLSEKEAAVYLAALELGPETAQNLAKKAGINRPTAYLQIESLKAKGLMSQIEKGKKTFFVAESPERLGSLLNNFENELNLKKAEMERILPALLSTFSGAGERPKVRFFEGVEGIRTMQGDFLRTPGIEQTESFLNLDRLLDLFPRYEDEFSKQRIAKGIKILAIYTSQQGAVGGASDEAKLREARFIESGRFSIGADVSVYGHKVAINTYLSKPTGVIIEDEDIAATFRSMFYLVWKTLSPTRP